MSYYCVGCGESTEALFSIPPEGERCGSCAVTYLQDKVGKAIADEQSSTEALVSALDEIEELEGIIYDLVFGEGLKASHEEVMDRICKKREVR